MPNVILVLRARAQVREHYLREEFSLAKAIHLAGQVTEDVVAAAIAAAPAPVAERARAVGDGAIIKAITDFLGSDLGKQLLALILALIGV